MLYYYYYKSQSNQFIDIWQPEGCITQAHNYLHCKLFNQKQIRVFKSISLCKNTFAVDVVSTETVHIVNIHNIWADVDLLYNSKSNEWSLSRTGVSGCNAAYTCCIVANYCLHDRLSACSIHCELELEFVACKCSSYAVQANKLTGQPDCPTN